MSWYSEIVTDYQVCAIANDPAECFTYIPRDPPGGLEKEALLPQFRYVVIEVQKVKIL